MAVKVIENSDGLIYGLCGLVIITLIFITGFDAIVKGSKITHEQRIIKRSYSTFPFLPYQKPTPTLVPTYNLYTYPTPTQYIPIPTVTSRETAFICDDSDTSFDNPIYYRGSVIYPAFTAEVVTTFDECNESGTQVIEAYCYPSDNGSEIPGTKTYDCPSGCVDGACVR